MHDNYFFCNNAYIQAYTGRLPIAGLMLGHRRRRGPNIRGALVKRRVPSINQQ